MNRRSFLKGAGALTVLASGGGVWRAHEQGVLAPGEGAAYEPWTNWRDHDDGSPLALVAAAILAANPHNTQPWAFRVTESRVEILADEGRNLGAFDPFLREMHIGLGCALENLLIACEASGYGATVHLPPGRLENPPASPQRTLVARIDLEALPRQAAAPPRDLHGMIPLRHTNRGPYDPSRPVPREVLASIVDHEEADVKIFLFTEGERRARFRELIVRATEGIIADEEMVLASERWFRHRRSEIESFRDGPTLDAAGLSPLVTTLAKLLPRPSAAANHQYWLDATREVQVPTAPVLGMIAVRDLYDREQSLLAGRIWQRMHLRATRHGVAMQPLNQPVELVDRERELALEPRTARALEEFTGDAAWQPTFAFRAGFALREGSASPRRALEMVLA